MMKTYKVISENEELNDSINYLSTALTYDNETIQLTPQSINRRSI
jgi:ATP-dependent helicase/nuclease subunit B